MTHHTLISVAAGVLATTFLVALAVSPPKAARSGAWRLPAAAFVAFLAFSALVMAAEGPLGFWPEHTRNLWANQIWIDLLLLGTIGLALALPRMRAVGMRPLPWFGLVLATGSIGFLALLARLLRLEERRAGEARGASGAAA